MLVLSGDIGGTNSRLQLTNFASEKQFDVMAREGFLNADFDDFSLIVQQFLTQHKIVFSDVERCCFAVAGPIVEGAVKFTNLPWFISEVALRDSGLKQVKLINDFEAVGYGVDTLKPEAYHVLQKGEKQNHKVRAIMGAGTGLGVAISVFSGTRYQVIPTEGGHVDFAPTDEMQMALLTHLRKKLHRVSIERLVSGQGLVNIYQFVREHPLFNETEHPELKRILFHTSDKAAEISRYAIEQHDPFAMHALDLFVRIYGACAGNLALTTLPYSGLYIVGGIAPKLLKQLMDGRFLRAFSDKGRMSDLLAKIPIYVVMDTDIGLQGAANYACFYLK
ncbi:MAG: glucokinase [Gammaproteobacteria bacterium]|nr:glucokinase [Gammaproteobacteria bacterium]